MRILYMVLAICGLFAAGLAGQQAAFNNSGGVVTLGTDFVISGSSVTAPAGSFAFDCPATALPPGQYSAQWDCTGGTLTIQSSDGLTAVNGIVTAGTVIETASGGGRGHGTTYYYALTATFTGTMTVNGQPEAIRGATSQAVAGLSAPLGSGTIYSGVTNVNAAYEPIYITDTYNSRIVRMDNMSGDNWTTFGTSGSGVKQFELPWGLYVDAAGKIYVTDTSACRVVRMDDMLGTNWTALGSCGPGSLQFNSPSGVFADAAGNIYVADTGNNRIVRVSDMAGDNWVALGAAGSGAGQFKQPGGVAVNALGQIYVADSGNNRMARVDDMTGANWVSFGAYGSGTGQFDTASAVTLDSTGRIYVVDIYNSRIVRMDDMSGTNWTVLGGSFGSGTNQFINPYGVGVDPFGTIYVADSRNYRLVMADNMSGSDWTTYGTGGTGVGGFDSPTSIFAVPPASPLAVTTFSSASLTFSDTIIGMASAPQTVTMANIGSATLAINSIAPVGDFQETNTCGNSLAAGQSCVIRVTFAPTAGGDRTGSIALDLGPTGLQAIALSGLGSLVSISPTTVNFGVVQVTSRRIATVTIANPGAAAAGISSVTLTGAAVFQETNHCPASLASNTSCTISLRFAPRAGKTYNGRLTITDASGATQAVAISGIGNGNH